MPDVDTTQFISAEVQEQMRTVLRALVAMGVFYNAEPSTTTGERLPRYTAFEVLLPRLFGLPTIDWGVATPPEVDGTIVRLVWEVSQEEEMASDLARWFK